MASDENALEGEHDCELHQPGGRMLMMLSVVFLADAKAMSALPWTMTTGADGMLRTKEGRVRNQAAAKRLGLIWYPPFSRPLSRG